MVSLGRALMANSRVSSQAVLTTVNEDGKISYKQGNFDVRMSDVQVFYTCMLAV